MSTSNNTTDFTIIFDFKINTNINGNNSIEILNITNDSNFININVDGSYIKLSCSITNTTDNAVITVNSNNLKCYPKLEYKLIFMYNDTSSTYKIRLYIKDNLTLVGETSLSNNTIKNSNPLLSGTNIEIPKLSNPNRDITFNTSSDLTINDGNTNTKILYIPYEINDSDIHLYAYKLLSTSNNQHIIPNEKPTFTKPSGYDFISLFKFNKLRLNLKKKTGLKKLTLNQLYIFKYDFDNKKVINLMSPNYIKQIELSNGTIQDKKHINDGNEFTSIKSSEFISNDVTNDKYLDIVFKDYHNIYDIISIEFKNIIDYNERENSNFNIKETLKKHGIVNNSSQTSFAGGQSSFATIVDNIEYFSNKIRDIEFENNTNPNNKGNTEIDYISLLKFDIKIDNNNAYHRIIYYNENYTTNLYLTELEDNIDIYIKKLPYVPHLNETGEKNENPTLDYKLINCDYDDGLHQLCFNNIDFNDVPTFDNIYDEYMNKIPLHRINNFNPISKYRKRFIIKNIGYNDNFMILIKFVDLENLKNNLIRSIDRNKEDMTRMLNLLKVENDNLEKESYFTKDINEIINCRETSLLIKKGNECYSYFLDNSNTLLTEKITNLNTNQNNYIIYEDDTYYKLFYYISNIGTTSLSSTQIKDILCHHNKECNIDDNIDIIENDEEIFTINRIFESNINLDVIQRSTSPQQLVDIISQKLPSDIDVTKHADYIYNKLIITVISSIDVGADYFSENVIFSSPKGNITLDIANADIPEPIRKKIPVTLIPSQDVDLIKLDDVEVGKEGFANVGNKFLSNKFSSISAFLYSNN
jgi:hypothetical protein